MTDRPILMGGPMVRAILRGDKTQTRRPVKYSPIMGEPDDWCHKTQDRDFARLFGDYRRFCHHGQPGDRLWVRETFGFDGDVVPARCRYRADGEMPTHPILGDCWRWTPSIHMPRWASRLTLGITAVRVERLQDITDADSRAEGVSGSADPGAARYGYASLWNGCYRYPWESNPWVWVLDFEVVTDQPTVRP